jgi:thiamine biosynthesis lipoprotein
MASYVRVLLGADCREPADCLARVESVFAEVQRQCTRFDATSDLMRANAAGVEWHPVGGYCFAALESAAQAHERTGGLFDPRVLRTLTDLGYDRSLPFAAGGVRRNAAPAPARGFTTRWQPGFDVSTSSVRIGPDPVDLGGIGKGLALRWAAELLDEPTLLIDAGGDCIVRGAGPDGTGWRVGVENPRGGTEPLAVLRIRDAACATSSVRVRRWRAGSDEVHHLIDPRTARPGGDGLLAVTVIADDPADAEVLSKVLFLHGSGIAACVAELDAAAIWVDGSGAHVSTAAEPAVLWRAA